MKKEQIRDIRDALALLNDVAEEAGEEIKDIIASDYKSLRNVFVSRMPDIKDSLKEIQNRSVEKIIQTKDNVVGHTVEAMKTVDRTAHQNPWAFMAGLGLSSLLFGFLAGRKGKS